MMYRYVVFVDATLSIRNMCTGTSCTEYLYQYANENARSHKIQHGTMIKNKDDSPIHIILQRLPLLFPANLKQEAQKIPSRDVSNFIAEVFYYEEASTSF